MIGWNRMSYRGIKTEYHVTWVISKSTLTTSEVKLEVVPAEMASNRSKRSPILSNLVFMLLSINTMVDSTLSTIFDAMNGQSRLACFWSRYATWCHDNKQWPTDERLRTATWSNACNVLDEHFFERYQRIKGIIQTANFQHFQRLGKQFPTAFFNTSNG